MPKKNSINIVDMISLFFDKEIKFKIIITK